MRAVGPDSEKAALPPPLPPLLPPANIRSGSEHSVAMGGGRAPPERLGDRR